MSFLERQSSKAVRLPLSGIAILITLQNMTAVANARVYCTCLKMLGVMNVKIAWKKFKFRTGDNRGSVVMCLSSTVCAYFASMDWLYQGICLAVIQEGENSGRRCLFNRVWCICRQIDVWKLSITQKDHRGHQFYLIEKGLWFGGQNSSGSILRVSCKSSLYIWWCKFIVYNLWEYYSSGKLSG